MNLMLNGEPVETSAATVAELVREQCGASARVAVVLNDHVVPAAAQAATALTANDRVEFLTFAGGG